MSHLPPDTIRENTEPVRLKRNVTSSSLEEISRLLPEDSHPELSPAAAWNPVSSSPAPSSNPPFLSLREAANWLCVSLSRVKRLLARGELASVRIGARQKIPSSELTVYISKDILLPDQIKDNQDCEQ